jgi:hypothetical protein
MYMYTCSIIIVLPVVLLGMIGLVSYSVATNLKEYLKNECQGEYWDL